MGSMSHSGTAGGPRSEVPWINLLGMRLSALDLDRAVDRVLAAVERREGGYVCIRDAHGVVKCHHDPALRAVHNNALLVTPDGMPLVWALRLAGHREADRVYGPDLMLALFDRGRDHGLRHFLYGATPETLDLLEARLLAQFPGTQIAGRHAPPFRALTEAERSDVAAQINASGADIVWVGLGTPKQELWMAEMQPLLPSAVLIGVGAAFDFHAGGKRQAPRFIQRSGLEWLFRLASEPRRLWRRYAVTVPSFMLLCACQALRLRSFPVPPAPDAPQRAAPEGPAMGV
ncbi:WecB/TagA/CpsF family glycosyltransferase [Paracoccus sp. S-4012]|nr:WecB/TagA/CpsF family glycosyltransferase [Paracoccus sp. S-4012]